MEGEAVAVRGGILSDLDRVLRYAEKEFREGYGSEQGLGWGFSVCCGAPDAAEDRNDFLCRMATLGEIPNKQVRVVRVAELEHHGFRIVHMPPPDCHYDIDLGTENQEVRLSQLEILFESPEPNPCPFDN